MRRKIAPRERLLDCASLYRRPAFESLEERRVLNGDMVRVSTPGDDLYSRSDGSSHVYQLVDGRALYEDNAAIAVDVGDDDVFSRVDSRTAIGPAEGLGGAAGRAAVSDQGLEVTLGGAQRTRAEASHPGTAAVTGSWATGGSSSSVSVNTTYVYQDSSPTLGEQLVGTVVFGGAGNVFAAGAGPLFNADCQADSYASVDIYHNGLLLTTITMRGTARGSTPPPGASNSWTIERDGIPIASARNGGVEAAVTFVVPSLGKGDTIQVVASISASSGADSSLEEGRAVAFARFAQFARISADVRSTGPISGPPTGVVVPGTEEPPVWISSRDVDGNGTVDESDLEKYADDIDSWIQGTPSHISHWADILVKPVEDRPLVVTTEDDESNSGYSFYDLSLREALELAAVNPGLDSIEFAPWIRDITLSGTELNIGSEVEIGGPDSKLLTIDANGLSRVFTINAGVNATISGLTITGGYSNVGGGAIYSAGDLTLDSVTVSYSEAGNGGGGVYSDTTGKLTVKSSTFHHNDSGANKAGGAIVALTGGGHVLTIEDSVFYENEAGSGGAVKVQGNNGGIASNVSITNSTFSANTAAGSGGALSFQSFVGSPVNVSIINSTIAYNSAAGVGAVAGGVYNVNPDRITISLHNTILAENSSTTSNYRESWGSLAGTVSVPSSHNLIGWGATGHGPGITNGNNGNQVGTVTAINPLLAPLGDYGGKTKTHALKVSSPALEAGNDSLAPAFDQRGKVRPISIGGISDIGAFEANDGLVLTVRVDYDRSNVNSYIEDLSIREALTLSRQLAGVERIEFAPELFEDGVLTITLGSSLVTSHDYTLVGPGAGRLILDGNGSRVLSLGGTNTLEGFTVTGGIADSGAGIWAGGDVALRDIFVEANEATDIGGGIFNEGTLALDGVRVIGNISANGGGGIYSTGNLSVRNSEVAENSVTQWFGNGGGIYHSRDLGGSIAILNSTISENSTASGGGGIGGGVYIALTDGDFDATDAVIINSTISANTADSGSGLYTDQLMGVARPVLMHNSIVVDNAWDIDIEGVALDGSSTRNLVRDGYDGGLAGPDNIVLLSTDSSGVESLDYYRSGRIRTHALLASSPAVDAADDAIASLWNLEKDQRGLERDIEFVAGGSLVDIGALELAIDEYYY